MSLILLPMLNICIQPDNRETHSEKIISISFSCGTKIKWSSLRNDITRYWHMIVTRLGEQCWGQLKQQWSNLICLRFQGCSHIKVSLSEWEITSTLSNTVRGLTVPANYSVPIIRFLLVESIHIPSTVLSKQQSEHPLCTWSCFMAGFIFREYNRITCIYWYWVPEEVVSLHWAADKVHVPVLVQGVWIQATAFYFWGDPVLSTGLSPVNSSKAAAAAGISALSYHLPLYAAFLFSFQ